MDKSLGATIAKLVISESSMSVTINDIARLSGVSKRAVSRVINSSQVSEATREKVAEIIKQTGFSPIKQAGVYLKPFVFVRANL